MILEERSEYSGNALGFGFPIIVPQEREIRDTDAFPHFMVKKQAM